MKEHYFKGIREHTEGSSIQSRHSTCAGQDWRRARQPPQPCLPIYGARTESSGDTLELPTATPQLIQASPASSPSPFLFWKTWPKKYKSQVIHKVRLPWSQGQHSLQSKKHSSEGCFPEPCLWAKVKVLEAKAADLSTSQVHTVKGELAPAPVLWPPCTYTQINKRWYKSKHVNLCLI